MKKIKTCESICSECAFNGNSKDVLYAESYNIIENGIIFPCHMYLRSKSGNDSFGTEKLDEIKVCRGYVAFMKKYFYKKFNENYYWNKLFKEIKDEELSDIKDFKYLFRNNVGLREEIYLNNGLENG